MRRIVEAASHLCVINGLYIGAMVGGVGAFIGDAPGALAVVVASVFAMGVFLIDRVRIADRFFDPADIDAHPARSAFYARFGRAVRAVALGAIVCGIAWAVWQRSGLLLLVTLGAPVGVVVYGALPRGLRIKDAAPLKNVIVGASIGAACCAFALGSLERLVGEGAGVIAAFAFVTAHGSVDALLCDLDDAGADAAHGARTLAYALGDRLAWRIAVGANLSLCAGALLWAARNGAFRWELGAWGVGPLATLLLVRAARPARVRDWVDLRMVAVGVCAALLA